MFIKRGFVFGVLVVSLLMGGYSQSNVAVGGWKVYSNYSTGCDVDIIDNNLFYASKGSVMRVDLQENTMHPITKVEGLSDVGIQCAKANQNTKTLVICYSNSNIDIYQNGRVTNIPDIYNRQMTGDKAIHSVFTHDTYAYLACGFGVVVLDLKKKVISDSWIFRQNNQDYPVKDIIITQDGTIYAATDHALLKNTIDNPQIKDFATWEQIHTINTPNNNSFKQLADLNGHLFVLKTDTTTTDTSVVIYSQKNNVWEKDTFFTFDEQNDPRFYYTFIRSSLGKLIVGNNFGGIKSYYIDPVGNLQFYAFYCGWCYDAVTAMYIADSSLFAATFIGGLYRGHTDYQYYYDMQGPANGAVTAMNWKNSTLAVVHNTLHGWWPAWYQGHVSFLQNNSWITTGPYDDIADVIAVTVAPYDSSVVFAASFVRGLLEYKDNISVARYNNLNSILETTTDGTTRVTSPVFDKDNNLWFGNWGTNYPLIVRMKDGTWKSLPIHFYGMQYLEKIFIDSRGTLWLICQMETELVIFNPNGTPDNTANHQWANLNLNISADKGDINHVYAVAEDKEGKIWLGTDNGLKYYSRSSELFNDPNILPEPLYVVKDSLTELLLSADPIKCIKIDGGSRKWIGTENAGVYLLSADCKEEIFHFTTENSPLLSNTIHSIEINGETGEVYFGTENGLIAFRYTATDPKEQSEELKIFPNPVRETFNGYISIEGLKENSEVKITDSYGGIVYRTVSNGGTASWDGRRFNGQKAATGVYFVFVSDELGQERIAGKILVIK